jgi:hypothetical protein
MGETGRLRALAGLYVGFVVLCAAIGIVGELPGLSTLALVLTLPAGFGYGPLGVLLRVLPVDPPVVRTVLNLVLIGALAVVNVSVLRWARRVLPADPAAVGVADRLTRTLVGSGVSVTPMARRTERVRSDSGEVRLERSLDLRDLQMPYRELLGVFGSLWHRAGLRVQQRPDPPALRAFDEQGYEFLVEPGEFGEAVLQVASPPARERGFLLGALVSGVPTVLLFAFGLVLFLATGGDSALFPLILGCLVTGPGSLAVGVLCLFRFRSRAFGRGLILGGLPSLIVALLYAAPVLLQGH